jgi:hypothetical protein
VIGSNKTLRAAVGLAQYAFLTLLCAQALCQTAEQASDRPLVADSLETLAGIFESAVRGDSFFGGGTTNAAPLFTVTLGTNGTYFVFCARVDIEPGIDGGKSFLRPGNEFGTWRWDRGYSEVVFTATNRIHMTRVFPTHMKVEQRPVNRLTAINAPPSKDLLITERCPWVPLSPPYFYRKVQ